MVSTAQDTVEGFGEGGQSKLATNELYGPSTTTHAHQTEIEFKDDDIELEFTLANFVYFLQRNKFKLQNKAFITKDDMKNGFKGFRNFTLEKDLKRLPCQSNIFKILYKVGLLIFYVIHFLYPMIALAITTEHVGYNVVCGIISLIGLIYELYELIPDLYHHIKIWKQKQNQITPEETNQSSSNGSVTVIQSPKQKNEARDEARFSYIQDAKFVFKKFTIDSLGETLLYPSIICNLYGFINERGWEFDNAVGVINFLLLIYSLVMDAIYGKLFHVWVIQKLIRYSYAAYHEIVGKPKTLLDKLGVYFTPFALTVPFSVLIVLMQWFVLAIIGVRIYVDNFSQEKVEDTQQMHEKPETGDYKAAPFTRYMIFCGAYFPFASTLVYILLNKYWYLEIYQVISGNKNWKGYIPVSVKWLAFLVDFKAYVAVILLVAPVIPFVIGAFLLDYDESDFEVEPEARAAAEILIICFSATFLLPNFQASIIFTIILIIILLIIRHISLALGECIEGTCCCKKK